YRVFTPFWKNFLQTVAVSAVEESPATLPPSDNRPASANLEELRLLPEIDWAQDIAKSWQPGEAGALKQLDEFCHFRMLDYMEKRDIPGTQGVSRLSPHLHFGEVSPRQVWWAVKDADAGKETAGAAGYLREIGWREFAHYILFHFPHTPAEPMYEKYRDFPWREGHEDLLRAWQQGQTGYPIVDAGMRELWSEGWMHNRVRMIVASLLVKNLRIPWQKGARWFWDTLVDADLANNTMGWQWSAGCGADAAPYFRIFNPVTQSEKFDPDGAYIRKWVPELERLPDKWIHKPWDTPAEVQKECGFRPGVDYPSPVIDYATSRREALDALQALKNR
ncbi:MAG: DNA photolyase family protein, partial [Gammaproteobacteria bacterium]|nr:DNA photolyase family protein [Gammaproteobacteria bacterium]